MIRLAQPGDRAAVEAIVATAYSIYVERIGKPPGPMVDDYAALIGAGAVSVFEVDGTIAALIVLLPKPDHLLLDNRWPFIGDVTLDIEIASRSVPRPMQSEPSPPTAQHCREEAARIRLGAVHFTAAAIRRQLLDIAAQYERLADSLDLHAKNRLLRSDTT